MNVSMKFILFERPISTKTHVSSFMKSRKTIEYIADLIKIDLKARFISKLQTNTIQRYFTLQKKLSMSILHQH